MSLHRAVLFRLALMLFITSTMLEAKPEPRVAEHQQTEPERVSADSARTTPGGATFTVPSGWSIASGPHLAILQPPESDTHIVIFDAQADNAKAAVEAAWAAYKPDFKRPLQLITPRPPHEG